MPDDPSKLNATVELCRPDGTWKVETIHNYPAGTDPQEAAEHAIRATLGTLPEARDPNGPALVARATVRQVVAELESGATVHDAATDEPIRPATWRDLAESINAPDGVVEIDGRRAYVA